MLKFVVPLLLIVLQMNEVRMFRLLHHRRHHVRAMEDPLSDNYLVRDHKGCDIPVIGFLASCGPKGKCCDWHDQCLKDNGCGSLIEGMETLQNF
jgi:hypothetical protein